MLCSSRAPSTAPTSCRWLSTAPRAPPAPWPRRRRCRPLLWTSPWRPACPATSQPRPWTSAWSAGTALTAWTARDACPAPTASARPPPCLPCPTPPASCLPVLPQLLFFWVRGPGGHLLFFLLRFSRSAKLASGPPCRHSPQTQHSSRRRRLHRRRRSALPGQLLALIQLLRGLLRLPHPRRLPGRPRRWGQCVRGGAAGPAVRRMHAGLLQGLGHLQVGSAECVALLLGLLLGSLSAVQPACEAGLCVLLEVEPCPMHGRPGSMPAAPSCHFSSAHARRGRLSGRHLGFPSAPAPLHFRSCNGGQAKAMLAVTVLVLVVAAAALFARDWRFGAHGPGIMTKIKIFITHFQVGTAQHAQHGLLQRAITRRAQQGTAPAAIRVLLKCSEFGQAWARHPTAPGPARNSSTFLTDAGPVPRLRRDVARRQLPGTGLV